MIMVNDHGSSGTGAKCKRVNSLAKKISLTAVGIRQLVRRALAISLPVVRFRIPRGAQYWDIISMLGPWARHFTLICFT